MPPVAAGIGAVGGLASDILGANAASNATNKANNLAQQGINAFRGINLPNIADMQFNPQAYQVTGKLNPLDESAVGLQNSQFGGIQDDPRLLQAQMNALSGIQNISSNHGLDPAAQAQLAQIQLQENQNEKGQRDAILQNAAQRGVSGSGLEMASQLSAQQAGANRQNSSDLDVAAQAQARALQALQAQAGLGGQMQAQQYGEAARSAEAQDAINRFNASNQQNVQNTNIQNQNQAQASNLANAQQTSNANTASRNAAQEHNAGLYQQNYQNQLAKAGGIAGQSNVAAGTAQQGGQGQAALLGGLGNSLMGMGTSFYNYGNRPAAAKFDSATGQALFDPQTGEQYQKPVRQEPV